jgi:hypothetical protein
MIVYNKILGVWFLVVGGVWEYWHEDKGAVEDMAKKLGYVVESGQVYVWEDVA